MRTVAVLAALFVLIASFGMAADAEKEAAKHEYVGVKKCKICHKKDGIHPSWAESKHATAWDSLSAEQQKDEKLLPFYTTGTTAKGDLLTGVQCEACHGAGADYKKKAIMEDQKKSVAAGLVIPTAETCMTCHNEKAPAALAAIAKDFDFAKAVAKGIHKMHEAEAAKK